MPHSSLWSFWAAYQESRFSSLFDGRASSEKDGHKHNGNTEGQQNREPRDGMCPERHPQLEGAEVEDRLTERRFNVRAKLVANVTGPWADLLLETLSGEAAKTARMVRSKGIHLITRPIVQQRRRTDTRRRQAYDSHPVA